VNAGTCGAGLLAAVALGELTFGQIPDRVRVARSYQPDPATKKLYDTLSRDFTGPCRRNREACTRLNRERAGMRGTIRTKDLPAVGAAITCVCPGHQIATAGFRRSPRW
jgi:hypothetical protein